ncbi:hypothetical protein [Streptomyces sp. NPDC049813]|uniref:hypothetical protein n=1 Tax=Streptomyces sp. NPDC049813 TaxID=3365597 RepID=UPI0037B5A9A2
MDRIGQDDDTAVYYRGSEGGFAPRHGGVFNGGGWLDVDGRRVDVHHRDLDSVEHELREAGQGAA